MKPLIGISTNFTTVSQGKFLGLERIYVNKDYTDAVVKSGGTPLLLPPVESAESICQYVSLCQGFILSGGGDINPLLYGCDPHPKLEGIHTTLDRTQWLLTQKILEAQKPLLAICRGEQLLNVVLGGTLWQDLEELPSPTFQHSQVASFADKIHEVTLTQGSVLWSLFGDRIAVNSLHHQSICTLGKGLEAIAVANDGIIEAIQLKDSPFTLGIQWHPEMLLTGSDEMLPLFQELIRHSSLY